MSGLGEISIKPAVQIAVRTMRAIMGQRMAGYTVPVEALCEGVEPDLVPELKRLIQSGQGMTGDQIEEMCADFVQQYLGSILAGFVGSAAGLQGKSIFQQVYPRIEKLDTPDCKVTYIRLPRPLEVDYQAINEDPHRVRDGISRHSSLLAGFKNDIVPCAPIERTVVIHFGAANGSRGEQEDVLRQHGEVWAPPGELAIVAGALSAGYGIDLFQHREQHHTIRTGKSETKEGFPIWALRSFAGGVYEDDSYLDSGGALVAPAGIPLD